MAEWLALPHISKRAPSVSQKGWLGQRLAASVMLIGWLFLWPSQKLAAKPFYDKSYKSLKNNNLYRKAKHVAADIFFRIDDIAKLSPSSSSNWAESILHTTSTHGELFVLHSTSLASVEVSLTIFYFRLKTNRQTYRQINQLRNRKS